MTPSGKCIAGLILGGGTMTQEGRGVLKRSLLAAALIAMVATPAIAEWRLPCILSGCSITFVSPEYAARPVQPLNPEAALAAVNAFRTKNGRGTVILDTRLTKAAAMQSADSGHAKQDRP